MIPTHSTIPVFYTLQYKYIYIYIFILSNTWWIVVFFEHPGGPLTTKTVVEWSSWNQAGGLFLASFTNHPRGPVPTSRQTHLTFDQCPNLPSFRESPGLEAGVHLMNQGLHLARSGFAVLVGGGLVWGSPKRPSVPLVPHKSQPKGTARRQCRPCHAKTRLLL